MEKTVGAFVMPISYSGLAVDTQADPPCGEAMGRWQREALTEGP